MNPVGCPQSYISIFGRKPLIGTWGPLRCPRNPVCSPPGHHHSRGGVKELQTSLGPSGKEYTRSVYTPVVISEDSVSGLSQSLLTSSPHHHGFNWLVDKTITKAAHLGYRTQLNPHHHHIWAGEESLKTWYGSTLSGLRQAPTQCFPDAISPWRLTTHGTSTRKLHHLTTRQHDSGDPIRPNHRPGVLVFTHWQGLCPLLNVHLLVNTHHCIQLCGLGLAFQGLDVPS